MSFASVLPFPLKEAQASATAIEHAKLVGRIFHYNDQGASGLGPLKLRLVKLNLSGGFGSGAAADAAKNKVFKWVDQTLNTVEPVAAATDRPCGVSTPYCPNLSQGDLFWVIMGAGNLCEMVNGTGTTTTAGNFLIPDNDADLGKVDDGGTSVTQGVDFAICRETAGSADTTITAALLHDLVG